MNGFENWHNASWLKFGNVWFLRSFFYFKNQPNTSNPFKIIKLGEEPFVNDTLWNLNFFLYLCFVHPIFRLWSLLTMKLQTYKILHNLCLHSARQNGQEGKNRKKVMQLSTKNQKTKIWDERNIYLRKMCPICVNK